MVITPEQVKEKASKQDRAVIRKLEKQIDGALLEGSASITLVGGLNPRLKYAILHEYESAGWEVTYQHNQGNNDFLYFHEQRRPIGFGR